MQSNKLNKLTNFDLYHWLIWAVAFTMPFTIKINNLFIVCALVYLILSGKFFPAAKAVFYHRKMWLLLIYYAFHVFSVLFSSNATEALLQLERKLVLLVFPLLLLQPYTDTQFKRIGYGFVTGVTLSLIYSIVSAIWQYQQYRLSNVFFYHSLSNQIGMHAVYLSCYAVFSIFFLLHYFNEQSQPGKVYSTIILSILFISTVLLSSKMLLGVLCFGLLFWMITERKIGKKHTGGVLILIVIILGSTFFMPSIRQRFTSEFSSNFDVVYQTQYTYDTPFTGTTLRLTIWKHCLHILSEQEAYLFGVGTGDVQTLLNQTYQSTGMYMGNAELKDTGYVGYGPHNQYMETLMSFGLVGLIFFIYMLVSQLKFGLDFNNTLFILFLVMMLMFMLTESVLNSNKGIIFYTFFYVLFCAKITIVSKE